MSPTKLLIAAIFGFVVPGSLVNAQTLFIRQDTSPNYTAYNDVDACIAGLNRLIAEHDLKDSIWRDTAEFDKTWSLTRRIPTYIVQVGRVCFERIDVDTLPLTRAHDWAAALLIMNRDTDAQRIHLRWFDSLPLESYEREFERLLKVYADARPRRTEALNNIYNIALEKIPTDSIYWIISVKLMAVHLAAEEDEVDEKFVSQLESEILTAVDSNPSLKVQHPTLPLQLFGMLLKKYKLQSLDSLGVSTDAYSSFTKHLGERAGVDLSSIAYGNIGSIIEGDYWFQPTANESSKGGLSTKGLSQYYGTTKKILPSPNKVNMIVFLQGSCHTSSPRASARSFNRLNDGGLMSGVVGGLKGCWSTFAAIHRFKRAYPNLEITIKSGTFGFLGDAPPLIPSDEADSLAKYFLNFHRLPATLVVSTTDFFRVEGIDQRRIDQRKPYMIGDVPLKGNVGYAVVSDELGKVFHYVAITGEQELELKYKLDAVFKRINQSHAHTKAEP